MSDTNLTGSNQMTLQTMQRTFAILTVGLFMGVLGACDEQGPAEEAGEAVDNAAENAGEAMEEAGEEAQDNAN
jgi:hypothetical protein